jgi:transforming growth factor-beta-induced protein
MMRLALVLVGVACVVAKTQNIVQLAQATPDLSTLVTALTAGGLTETLSGKGPFTVFAPTNEAFAKIETKALNALLQNKAELDKVLEYHVLAADLRMRELMAVKVVKTLEGEYVDVSDPGGVIKVNNAKVLTSDVAASNGFVHIIDTVLMTPSGPPLNITKDIVHVAQGNADLSTLVAALTAGKLVATLEGKGPFTVFAPTNKAFAKIPKHTLTKLLGNQKLLDQLLEYHVVSGDWSTRAMIGEMKSMYKYDFLPTLEKEDVIVRSMNNAIMVNNANVVLADVEATNGVVHVVDKVLVPPNFPLALYPLDIVELSESQLSLPTFVQALVAGKLTATLSGKGPYTVFAPTNNAFGKIPAADLQKLLANPTELDKVLEYHVLSGKFSMRDLMSVRSAKTLEGDNVKVGGSGNVINVNDAKVLKADVEATNGVVHVIDTVLMLPKAPSPQADVIV